MVTTSKQSHRSAREERLFNGLINRPDCDVGGAGKHLRLQARKAEIREWTEKDIIDSYQLMFKKAIVVTQTTLGVKLFPENTAWMMGHTAHHMGYSVGDVARVCGWVGALVHHPLAVKLIQATHTDPNRGMGSERQVMNLLEIHNLWVSPALITRRELTGVRAWVKACLSGEPERGEDMKWLGNVRKVANRKVFDILGRVSAPMRWVILNTLRSPERSPTPATHRDIDWNVVAQAEGDVHAMANCMPWHVRNCYLWWTLHDMCSPLLEKGKESGCIEKWFMATDFTPNSISNATTLCILDAVDKNMHVYVLPGDVIDDVGVEKHIVTATCKLALMFGDNKENMKAWVDYHKGFFYACGLLPLKQLHPIWSDVLASNPTVASEYAAWLTYADVRVYDLTDVTVTNASSLLIDMATEFPIHCQNVDEQTYYESIEPKIRDHMPEVTIDMGFYRFIKLGSGDRRTFEAARLGDRFTGFGDGLGSRLCTRGVDNYYDEFHAAWTDPNCCYYVVVLNGKIISSVLAYRSVDGDIVFNGINNPKRYPLTQLYSQAAAVIARNRKFLVRSVLSCTDATQDDQYLYALQSFYDISPQPKPVAAFLPSNALLYYCFVGPSNGIIQQVQTMEPNMSYNSVLGIHPYSGAKP